MFNGFYGRLCTISFYFTTDIPDRSSFRYCGTETAIPTNGMCHLKEDSLPYKGSISCYENIIRADSNFSCIPFYELTDRYTLHYTIGLASNEVLKRRVARVEKAVHMLYVESREKYQHFFYFEYATGIWHKKQTYYAKVESTGIGLNTRLIVSNMDPKDAQEVYFNFYVMRGGGEASENRIKEVRSMCLSDRLSCHDFWASFFRLLKTAIRKTQFKKAWTWQVDTICKNR